MEEGTTTAVTEKIHAVNIALPLVNLSAK